jgi:hypothetical protein
VINHEEQYSIWPAERENALGWKDAGKSGSKTECLDFMSAPQLLRCNIRIVQVVGRPALIAALHNPAKSGRVSTAPDAVPRPIDPALCI